MNNEKIQYYVYNDDICFRKCSLFQKEKDTIFGNCTKFFEKDENWKTYYGCNQYGIHLHCTKHPEIELDYNYDYTPILYCPKCNKKIEFTEYESINCLKDLLKDCLKKLNYVTLNFDKFIRVDDWYYPEVKKREKRISDYWCEVDVKKDKDNDTMIVIYVGSKDSNKKSQFFIKPEKLQLTSDHKDLDPATILSKIEVTFKDRTLIQKYDNDKN